MAKKYPLISVVLLLVISAGIYFYGKSNSLIEIYSLLIGNLALWLITIMSFLMVMNSLKSDNPNALVRAKMSGTILKFFSVIILVLIYIFIHDRKLPHKANIFIFLGMYVIYMAVEAASLSAIAKKK